MLIGGDFRFFWPENIGDFATIPMAWDSSLNTGLGISALNSLWITSYFNFTALFSELGLTWNWISLLFWILPAVLISFLSSFLLFNYLFRKTKYSLVSGIIYALNTYFLMILTGGQLGVAMAYSMAPLVLARFIKLIDDISLVSQNFKFHPDKVGTNFKFQTVAGLVLAIQVLLDPRIVYITLIAILIYAILNIKSLTQNILSTLYTFVIPFGIASFIHAFWILPLLIFRISPLPQNFDSVQGFEFFSFADFSHALSLLHPNWPENVFGKTYFLKPEFIILPILAYGSLFFIKNSKSDPRLNRGRNPKQYQPFDSAQGKNSKYKIQNNLTIEQFNNRTIVFFALLGLLGAFLAKGANEPFGIINIWLFERIPGFAMFRDPTKFYLLIALSYSILIPFSVSNLVYWVNEKLKMKIEKLHIKISKRYHFSFYTVIFLFYILYFIFLIHPIFLWPTFKTREVPKEYIQLKDFLYKQPEFFRTFWIPQWQRFGYFSNIHPVIGREEILKGDVKKQVDELKKESFEKMLSDLSVKYIIVPYDSEGEIFLKDRKYDRKLYQKTIRELKGITWLKKVDCSIVKLFHCYDNSPFGKIVVFEIVNPKDHFWTPSKTLGMEYKFINPTKYLVKIKNAKRGDLLVFSEGFDERWSVESSPARNATQSVAGGEFKVQSSKFGNMLNSFVLPKDGNYEFTVYYEPQKWVNIGLAISGATFALMIALAIGLRLLNMVKYTHGKYCCSCF